MGNYYGGMEFVDSRSLKHYGIKGQKHGVRRFQNEDGTLTDAGKRRYDVGLSTGDLGYRSAYGNTSLTPYSHSGSASQRLNYTGNRRPSAPVHTNGTKESEEARE